MIKIEIMNDKVIKSIKNIATKYKVEQIILYGSRSRKDNTDTSDYDIAIIAPSAIDKDKTMLYHEIIEIETLKKIDIVFINEETDSDLLENINKDCVIIYEQIGDKD